MQSLLCPTFPGQSTVDRLVRVPISTLQNPAAPIVDDVKADLVRIDVYLPAGENREWGGGEMRSTRSETPATAAKQEVVRETLSCKGMHLGDAGDGFPHQVR